MSSVATEQTDNTGNCVLYDAECACCSAWARRAERVLKGQGVVFQPLPAHADEMKVVTAGGETFGGVAALVYLARRVWWAWPLRVIRHVPGMMRVLDRGYRWLARRRFCTSWATARRPLRSLTRRWSW